MRRPSVAGVELQWLAFVCRCTFGTASIASVFQTIFPVARSSASSRHCCGPPSFADAISPYSPTFSSAGFSETAVAT